MARVHEIDDLTIRAMCEVLMGMSDAGRYAILDQLLDVLTSTRPDMAAVLMAGLRTADPHSFADLETSFRALPMGREDHQESPPLDLLILTPKDVEFVACLRAFSIPAGIQPVHIGACRLWCVDIEGMRVGIATIGSDGNVEAAVEIGMLVQEVSFPAAVLVGMAAGVQGQVALGDLVVSRHVIAYESVRLTNEGPKTRAKHYAEDPRMTQPLATLQQTHPRWSQQMRSSCLTALDETDYASSEAHKLLSNWHAQISGGTLLAGSQLVEDGSVPELRDKHHDRVRALEMEGAGFAHACEVHGRRWLIVRGVADFGEEGREKHWQFLAAYAAAAFVRDFVLTGEMTLLDHPVRSPGS